MVHQWSDESFSRVDSLVPLMYSYDPRDVGSLILIVPVERILC